MAGRDDIIAFCDDTLSVGAFTDYCPNGLQVPGSAEVHRVATGVSAQLELIERAIEAGADLLLTHHGLFWDFHPRSLSEQMAARLRLALGAGLSIAGYHLPLDAHPAIGNNALVAEALGFPPGGGDDGELERFATVKGSPIGVIGRRDAPIPIEELTATIERELGQAPLLQGDGPELVGSLGVVTGSAAGEIHEAISLGLDAFLTGEPSEHAMADAREGGIHFLAAGHYATEVAGIKRLGEVVSERFRVEHVFVDIPNPV